MPHQPSRIDDVRLIRHIPFFQAVSEERSFRKAAERLNISQSALSRRIEDLERQLGNVILFRRHSRGVALTEAGQALSEEAGRLLADASHMRMRVEQVGKGARGALRIGFVESMVRHRHFLAGLASFHTQFPEVQIRMISLGSEQQRTSLRRGQLDVGFVFAETMDSIEFGAREVAVSNLQLILPTSHNLALRKTIKASDLGGVPLIFPSRKYSSKFAGRLMSELQGHGLDPQVVAETTSVTAALQFVAMGFGAALLIAGEDLSTPPGVVIRNISDCSFETKISAIWDNNLENKVRSNFLETLE